MFNVITGSYFNQQLNKTSTTRVRGPQGGERHPGAECLQGGAPSEFLSLHSSNQFSISETQTRRQEELQERRLERQSESSRKGLYALYKGQEIKTIGCLSVGKCRI